MMSLRPDVNTGGVEVDVLQLLWQTLEVEILLTVRSFCACSLGCS